MSAIQKYKRRAKELEEENAKLKAQLAERNNPKELDLATSEQLSKLEAELGDKGVSVIILGDDPSALLTQCEGIWADAYEALPEPYKSASCFLFWSEDGVLHCRPKDNQGSWVYYFNDLEGPGYPPYGWNKKED